MITIIPCAGRSSRFPNLPPKWTLPAPDGKPMLFHAADGVRDVTTRLIITVLREDAERYGVERALEGLGSDTELMVLERPTASQPATVARTIEALNISEQLLIKDCDNRFTLQQSTEPKKDSGGNFVCVSSLQDQERITPGNKSYVCFDSAGVVTTIREKEVISDTFCVGGYGFGSGRAFLQSFYKLQAALPETRELHISDVIGQMLLEGASFVGAPVEGYRDWGTLSAWRDEIEGAETIFVELDGYLFTHGSEHFSPTFDEVTANPESINRLQKELRAGKQIVYLSIRPEYLAAMTRQHLAALGLPTEPIIFGCRQAPWTLLAAHHHVMPTERARVETSCYGTAHGLAK